MEVDLANITEKVITLLLGGVASWAWKLRKDINSAFRKIRDLEEEVRKLNGNKDNTKT